MKVTRGEVRFALLWWKWRGARCVSRCFGESDPGRGAFRIALMKVTRGEVHFASLWWKWPGARSISRCFG